MAEQAILAKFGQHAHLLQLQEKGLLYMNNLPYFWEIEDEGLRGDRLDSVDRIERGHREQLTLSEGLDLEIISWTLESRPSEPEKISIFCMCALRPSAGTFPMHEKNLEFGNYALVVRNPREFINRVNSHLKSQGIKGKASLVKYVDDEHAGELGPFRKRRKFAYQSEWRLVCFDGPGGAREISIGSIRDISTIMPSNEVNDALRNVFRLPPSKPPTS